MNYACVVCDVRTCCMWSINTGFVHGGQRTWVSASIVFSSSPTRYSFSVNLEYATLIGGRLVTMSQCEGVGAEDENSGPCTCSISTLNQ